jgi:hypothetical protein
MFCHHLHISQAFVQGYLFPGDGNNGMVCISPPPGFTEDEGYVYQSVALSMACPALLVLGIPRLVLKARGVPL